MLTPDDVLRECVTGGRHSVFHATGYWADERNSLARQLLACREALRHYDKWAGYLKNLAFAQAGSTQHDAGRIARACLPEYENDEENKNGNQ